MEAPVGEQQTIEEVALGKLIDPFTAPFPFFHISDFEKLEVILKEGLVASNFANRANLPDYTSLWGSSWNDGYVSIFYPRTLHNISMPSEREVLIMVRPFVDPIKASNDLQLPSDILTPTDDEYLIRNRIAPREFIGIIHEEFKGDDSSHFPDYSNKSIVNMMKKINPSLVLPIYSVWNTALVWPTPLTREQIRNRVHS